MNVIEAWIKDLQEEISEAPLTVSDVRVGVFYTAVRLSSGDVGVAFTPRDLADTVCCPKSAASAPPAGRIAGKDAWEITAYALSPLPLKRSIGVAALNALSALALARRTPEETRILHDMDALAAIDLLPEDRVAMVGAFAPFIKALKGRVKEIAIIDKHRDALKPDELEFWRPPSEAEEVVSAAGIVIISGSALIEGEIDPLLEAAGNARQVVLAGPTASFWPPPFFERGVDVLGGIRVLNGEKVMQIVGEGGSGYFFFKDVAEKVCLVREGQRVAALS